MSSGIIRDWSFVTLYIYSPIVGPTGGTELLQQFCNVARSQGVDAKMLYESNPVGSPILEKFGFYGNPYVTEFEDISSNAIIIPEHFAEKAARVHRAKTSIWWMSVDNYWGASYHPDGYSYKDVYRVARRILYRPIHKRNLRVFRTCFHFYQSEYARSYLLNDLHIDQSLVYPLSDYIDLRYREDTLVVKRDAVLYNPKKGIKYTKRLIAADPSIDWVPLEGYSLDSLINVMQKSKLYIDFGSHPGKDRLPREAAACGCCVLTGTRGAAANDIDIPIDRRLKIDVFDVEEVLRRIHLLLDNYKAEYVKLLPYRKRIASEKATFEAEVRHAASILLNN